MARGGESTDAVDWTRQIAVFVLLFFAGIVAMIPSTSVGGNTYHPYAYLGWILIGISLLALVGPFYRTLNPIAPKARRVAIRKGASRGLPKGEVCPRCRTITDVDAKFCPKCGFRGQVRP